MGCAQQDRSKSNVSSQEEPEGYTVCIAYVAVNRRIFRTSGSIKGNTTLYDGPEMVHQQSIKVWKQCDRTSV